MPAPDSTGANPPWSDRRSNRSRRAKTGALVVTFGALAASCGQATVEVQSGTAAPTEPTQASVGIDDGFDPSPPASPGPDRPTEVVIGGRPESATEVVIPIRPTPVQDVGPEDGPDPTLEPVSRPLGESGAVPTTAPIPKPTIGSETIPSEASGPPPTIGSEALAVTAPVGPTLDLNSFEIVDGPSIRYGDEPGGPEPIPDEADTQADGDTGTIVVHAIDSGLVAYSSPDEISSVVEVFDNPTAQGGPLVLRATTGRPVNGWIEVLLPIRPNGTTGWVELEAVELTQNPYRIDLDVDDHELTVFRDETEVLRTKVSIGTGATPTPIGEFYLIELLRAPDPSGLYGPYAYGLSGFSETLSSFNGGDGVIGIHGTNEPQLLGSDVSHGCVRVDNEIITVMAAFLPLGTPVSIS